MLIRQSYESEFKGDYYVRFVYDMLCFLIINVVFINLIFGIIVDAFGVLRDENRSRNENEENICFICSLDRFVLEKAGMDFLQHTKKDHYIWNYLFYVYYLRKKRETEYNGIESHVVAKLRADDTGWFPVKRCLSMENKIEGEEFEMEMVVDYFAEKVAMIKKELDKLRIDKVPVVGKRG